MPEPTAARLLALLSLLQSGPDRSGPDLAARTGVTVRTVRRDVERLRDLGYPVESVAGAAGGYRLGPGGRMPPLLLDDEEAVAVAVGLRTAAQGSVTGIEEASLRALTKLDHVLPSRLRPRVRALHAATVTVSDQDAPTVDHETLAVVASACRSCERLRFAYVDHEGGDGHRRVEPQRLVSWWQRWYLVAWDLARDDWRTFRVDRLREPRPTGQRFAPREDPEGDVALYLQRRLGAHMWPLRARVRVYAPAEEVSAHGMGVVEPVDEHTCLLLIGGESVTVLAPWLGSLEADFEVLEPPELAEQVALLARRYARAHG
ncbi:helix-turn-helix transcriptional regulator [Nocardiopsis xinjiangensis]|uniref:helix-turn-helix transcriptional regulator n=1 Tax=Nocardiopsis xinjiangensis TaxID=124285 RepID=UPI00034C8A58|nr:YafY family protein [Nocardiopsis xinjiangensis]